MRRFDFRYQPVLQTKARLEDAEKAGLGEAMGAWHRHLQQLEGLLRTRAHHVQATRKLVQAHLEPGLLAMHAGYLERLDDEIAAQRQRLGQAQHVVDERRARLVEARRQRRVYEILRDNAWHQHRREDRRQQQLHLDEAGERLQARQGRDPVEAEYQEAGDDR